MYMAISSMRTTRPRLGVLCEAAGAVFLRRPTTLTSSSSALAQKKGALALAFHRAPPLHSWARPCTEDLSVLHTSPSSRLHHPLPLFGRLYYSTSRTQRIRKASAKPAAVSRVSANRKSLGSGKVGKRENSARRSVTVLATSRQKVTTSEERRDSRQPSTAPQKAGARSSSTKTLLKSKKSEVQIDSRDNNTQKQSQKRTVIAKPTSVSLRRSGVGVKKFTRGKEDEEGSAEPKTKENSTGSSKKGKRVMRLDPGDRTSKRLFEGYPLPGEEVQSEAPVALTGRVQFRQIVPSPKLMQHIQKHMLGRRRPSEVQRAGYDMKITPAPLDNIPFSKKGERQPIQEEVFRHKLRFAAAAKLESSFPPVDIPEVAFAGRSNVGKSSLINALTRQWGVARTSDKPGLTQSINFFRLGGRLCLVDLPGYGFAYAAEDKKEAWEELVKEFVTRRTGLKRVYVLVDAKWGLKLKDEELVELMERAGTKYQIVLTKSDTVTPTDLARRATQVQEVFVKNKSLVLPMLMVSSKTGEGLEFFRANVARLAKPSLI